MKSQASRTRKNAMRVIQRAYENHDNIEKYKLACARHWHFGSDEIDGMRAYLRIEGARERLASIGLVTYRDPDGTIKVVSRCDFPK